MVAFVFKTLADPYAGRVNLFRVYQGVMSHDSHVHNCRAHVKERIGQLLVPQGKETEHADEFGPGDIGAVAKLKETRAGDVLAAKDAEIPLQAAADAAPGDGVRHRGEGEGRRGEDGPGAPPPPGGGPDDRLPPRSADRRADPRRDHADPRGGDRRADEGALRRRGGASPAARALPRGDQGRREGPRALQEADRRPRAVRGLPHRDRAPTLRRGLRVRERDQGRRHPRSGSSRRWRRAWWRRCAPEPWRAIRCRT